MAFELSFSPLEGPMIQVEWKTLERKSWSCLSGHALLTDFLRVSTTLSYWRGETEILLRCPNAQLNLQFLDLFQGDVSYQLIDYGAQPIDRKRFVRVDYGRIDAVEFQESVYAAITDMVNRMGLEGYSEFFQMNFSMAEYKKLAKLLKRPTHLEEKAVTFDKDLEEQSESEIEMVWESSEGEDEDFEVSPDKELVRRSEFAILGKLIKKK